MKFQTHLKNLKKKGTRKGPLGAYNCESSFLLAPIPAGSALNT